MIPALTPACDRLIISMLHSSCFHRLLSSAHWGSSSHPVFSLFISLSSLWPEESRQLFIVKNHTGNSLFSSFYLHASSSSFISLFWSFLLCLQSLPFSQSNLPSFLLSLFIVQLLLAALLCVDFSPAGPSSVSFHSSGRLIQSLHFKCNFKFCLCLFLALSLSGGDTSSSSTGSASPVPNSYDSLEGGNYPGEFWSQTQSIIADSKYKSWQADQGHLPSPHSDTEPVVEAVSTYSSITYTSFLHVCYTSWIWGK